MLPSRVAPRSADAQVAGALDAVIRRATPRDLTWLVDLGARAFAALGDYSDILPAWLAQDNVSAWVAEHDGERRGFTVVGIFVGDATDSGGPAVDENVADLLALAVEPAWQSRGLGRRLLGHAVGMASASARTARLRELRLCVADDNFIGQRLYRTSGFERVVGDFGAYPGGQRAVRMVFPLAPATVAGATTR